MDNERIGQVEDYTNAFLGALYLVLVAGLVLIWGVWGYVVALALCVAIHRVIEIVGTRRARAEAEWDARVAACIARARR